MGGGGVSGGQLNKAVGGQQWLAGQGGQNMLTEQQASQAAGQGATDFYRNQMTRGLPFYRQLTDFSGGNIARAFAPQYGAVMRQTGQYAYLPSGYRDALLNNLRAQQGTAFDSQLTQAMMANEMAKQQGAAGLQGEQQIAGNEALGYGGLTTNANQSIIGGPQKPTVGGIIGGVAQAGLNTLGSYYGARG